MEHGIGGASSIIAILQLAGVVTKYVSAVIGASETVRLLSGELKTSKLVLEQLKSKLDHHDQNPEWRDIQNILDRDGSPLRHLEQTLLLLKNRLDKFLGSGGSKAIAKLKWPFVEPEVKQMLQVIRSEVELLHFAVTNDSHRLEEKILGRQESNNRNLLLLAEMVQESFLDLSDGLTTIKVTQSTMKRTMEVGERRSILEWLSSVDYGRQLSDYASRQQVGTGRWFLDSSGYKEWKSHQGRTLFCPGNPGAGKTMLATMVIKHLIEDGYRNSLAYIFCNHKREGKNGRLDDLLASLLRQIACGQSPLPICVGDLYETHVEKGTRPSVEELSAALEAVVSMSSQVFVVLDGLDECNDARRPFLKAIFKFQETQNINILATSRNIPDIANYFVNSTIVRVSAPRHEIGRYIDAHLSGDVGDLPSFISRNDYTTLRNEIKSTIVDTSQGTFLLAHLYVLELKDKPTPRAVRSTLKRFRRRSMQAKTPNDRTEDAVGLVLTAAYDDALERIQQQPLGRRQLAMKALAWAAFAKRPLSARELEEAVGAQILLEENADATKMEEEDIPRVEDIANTCVGLLAIREETDIVELVHYTTQEYLEKIQDRWFPQVQLQMLRTCLSYLSYDVFRGESDDNPHDHGATKLHSWSEFYRRGDLFYTYASPNWGYHTRKILSVCEEVINFLQDSRRVAAACHGRLGRFDQFRAPISGLHLAAHFGLDEVVERLLQDTASADVQDGHGQTPLMYAVEADNIAVIKTLLDRGHANTTARDFWGATAFRRAKSKPVQELLVAHSNQDVDWKDTFGRTQLSYAAQQGDLESVTFLVQLGADPDTRDMMGRTPLSYAAFNGEIQVMTVLKEYGSVTHDAPHRTGRSPLSYAAQNGHLAAVDFLVRSGLVIPDRPDAKGRTPLSYAAEEGHVEVVGYLLSLPPGNVNPNSTDVSSRSNLFFASARTEDRGAGVVRLLLAQPGIEINQVDRAGSTPLSIAARLGNSHTTRLLLEHGDCNLGVMDKFGRSALSWALLQGEWNVASLIVHKYLGIGEQPMKFWFPTHNGWRRSGFRCFICFLVVEVDGHCWCKHCDEMQDSPICKRCFSSGVGCRAGAHEKYES